MTTCRWEILDGFGTPLVTRHLQGHGPQLAPGVAGVAEVGAGRREVAEPPSLRQGVVQ
jgi:hypothetical protein